MHQQEWKIFTPTGMNLKDIVIVVIVLLILIFFLHENSQIFFVKG